jgi:CBS domain-containing protein
VLRYRRGGTLVKTLKDILAVKGNEVYAVGPNDSAFETVRLMDEKGVGALLVLDGDRVAGIVSERDVARKIALLEKGPRDTPASEIMSSRVMCARPDLTIQEGMALMTDKRVRHLPVLDQGKVVGVISIGDLVKAVIDEQQFMISQLEQYISS